MLLPALTKAKDRALAVGCLSNEKQIGISMFIYAGDYSDYFASTQYHWVEGPYQNSKGLACGGEWFQSDGKTPNTPAPLLLPQLPNPTAWVCPKRRRGVTYTSAPGDFDPSITGFLSYGFNEVGVFGRPSPNGNGTQLPFKSSQAENQSQMVMCADSSGSNNPNQVEGGSADDGTEPADAAWLDSVWLNNPAKFPRLQTAYAKHFNRSNVIYVDGHAASSKPSQLIWGQFAGAFSANSPNLIYLPGIPWNGAICPTSDDNAEWSSNPE